MFLTINNIKKSFGSGDSRIEVLKGINLSMEQGEFCVLLGPSGSGKSTLLNIIGGTSLAVYPAAGLIDYFTGKHLVVINRDATPRDAGADLLIQGNIGEVLSGI